MAHSSGLTDWLILHSDALELEVNHFTWTKEWLPRYTDVSISLRWKGNSFIGRSLALNEEESLVKAGAEALERLAQAQNEIPTSNGMAAHFSREAAHEGGLRELVERDRFLCHFLTSTPFLSFDEKILDDDLRAVIARLAKLGVRLEIREMRRLNEFFSVACAAFGENFERPFGMVAGFGCDKDLKNAAQRAFLECIRHVLPLVEEGDAPLTLEEFSRVPYPGPEEHYRLALHLDLAREHRNLFVPEAGSSALKAENFPLPTEVKELSLELPGDLPGFLVVQVSSKDLQPFYFGVPKEEDINREALRRFSKNPVKLQPHFLS